MPNSVNYFVVQSNPTREPRANPHRLGRIVTLERSSRHFERILALLRKRGPTGVHFSGLDDAPHLCGRSPRNNPPPRPVWLRVP
jgi:hypothetical protein